MADEPIEVKPGVYTMPGEPEIMGLCIMIDNKEAQWEVTTTDHYTTVIKIKKNSKWNVQEYTDPKTGKKNLQIFREGAKLNSIVLRQFIHPTKEKCTEEVYTPNAHAAKNEDSELRIFFTTPEDGKVPPIEIP
jgi:hypothetical protein